MVELCAPSIVPELDDVALLSCRVERPVAVPVDQTDLCPPFAVFFVAVRKTHCFCFDVAQGVCQPTSLALSEIVARMPPSPSHNLLPRLVSTSAGIQQAP